MNPILSIVIPTLNEERYLPLLLGDLAAQTNKSFEVIVVDGNSEDRTVQKAQDFKNELLLRVKKVTRRNLSFQRNTGAHASIGEYVLLLDADTRLDKNFVTVLIDHIRTDKALVYLPIILPLSNKLLYKLVFRFSNFLVKVSQNWNRPLPTQAAMIFERKFFVSLGGYRVHDAQDNKRFFPEDHEIIHRVKKAGVKVVIMQDVYVKVSQRRFQKKGEFKTLISYGIYAMYMTLFGRTGKTDIDYEMGGHVYANK